MKSRLPRSSKVTIFYPLEFIFIFIHEVFSPDSSDITCGHLMDLTQLPLEPQLFYIPSSTLTTQTLMCKISGVSPQYVSFKHQQHLIQNITVTLRKWLESIRGYIFSAFIVVYNNTLRCPLKCHIILKLCRFVRQTQTTQTHVFTWFNHAVCTVPLSTVCFSSQSIMFVPLYMIQSVQWGQTTGIYWQKNPLVLSTGFGCTDCVWSLVPSLCGPVGLHVYMQCIVKSTFDRM